MLMSNTSIGHNLCMSRGKKCNINVRREGVVMNGTRVWCDLSILSWQARYVIGATLCARGWGNFVIFLASERQDTSIHTFRTFIGIDPNVLEKISTAVVFLQTAVRQTGLQLPNDFDRCASSLA